MPCNTFCVLCLVQRHGSTCLLDNLSYFHGSFSCTCTYSTASRVLCGYLASKLDCFLMLYFAVCMSILFHFVSPTEVTLTIQNNADLSVAELLRRGTARRNTTIQATPSHLQYPINARLPAQHSCWELC